MMLFLLVFAIILSLGDANSFQTVSAAKKGKVTKISSDNPNGITQEEMLQQEPDFYNLNMKKTKKPKKERIPFQG